jgi:ribosomal protein L14E/L6E/L27E
MIYHKFVEIGRVVYIAKGKNQGKLAVIVNIIDGNKVINKTNNIFYNKHI